jgi:polar amino acid transport system substrate-binding protein
MRTTLLALAACLSVWSGTLWGAETGKGSLRLGFGTDKPPYIFEAEKRGLEYDIVVGAAKRAGFEVQTVFAPLSRLHSMLAHHELDGIATTNERAKVAVCYTKPYVEYHNVALALTSRHLPIASIADLANYSVSSFQRSRDLLGPDYNRMAESNPHYREEANQISRNMLLFSGRIDVIVGDQRILAYFTHAVADKVDVTQPVTVYELFAPIGYSVGFNDPKFCASFDAGLAELRRSGDYARIEERYKDY